MKRSSKESLDGISRHCTDLMSCYDHNRHTPFISEKYQSSRVTSSGHVQELTSYYFEQEQSYATSYLYANDYRHGIIDAIRNIIDELEDE